MENPADKDGLLLKHQLCVLITNNVGLMRVQLHHYCVWQVEPCHRLSEVARRSF